MEKKKLKGQKKEWKRVKIKARSGKEGSDTSTKKRPDFGSKLGGRRCSLPAAGGKGESVRSENWRTWDRAERGTDHHGKEEKVDSKSQPKKGYAVKGTPARSRGRSQNLRYRERENHRTA